MTDDPNKLGAAVHATQSLSSSNNGDIGPAALHADKDRADFYHNAMLRSTQAFGSGYPDGRLLVVNPAFEKLTGYTAEELRSISWATDLTPEKWRESEANVLKKLVETGDAQTYEKEYIRKDGSIVPVELLVDLVRDDNGEPAYYFSFINDISERKRSDKAFHRAERNYRLILDSISDGFFALDRDWRFTFTNPAACEILGVTADDLVGKVIWESYPGLVGSPFETVYRRVMDNGEPGSELAFYPDHDRWYDVTVNPYEEGISVSFRNVTEEKRSEEKLRAWHDTFKYFVEYSPFGVYVVDSDFRLIQVSAGAQKVFENVRPLLGRDFAEVLRIVWAEPFATEAIGHFRRTLETGETYHAPNTIETRNDIGGLESYDWKIERFAMPDGGYGVVCHFYDLSERQQYEAQLRGKEDELRRSTSLISAISDSTEDVIYAKDREGRMTFANPATLALIGKPLEEVIGRTDLELLQDKTAAAEVTANDRRIMDSGEVEDVEEVVPLPDGTRRIWYSHKMPYRDADGRVIGLLGVSRDITEITRAQELRQEILEREQRARRESDAANRAKDEFLAVLSHELRTPLHAIKGWLSLLSHDNLDPERRARAFEVISRNVDAQNALIEDILEVSRIISGKLLLEKSRESLVSIILDAVEEARPSATARAIVIETDIDPIADEVVADRLRVRQVLNNLLTNAIKFTPDGGRIDVRLERSGDSARLTVTDNGIGIEPDLLPQIFERFKQADSSSKRWHGGLGLGLAIVKHIVELHGGTITAHSEGSGRGAAFTVELPLAASLPSAESYRKAAGSGQGSTSSDRTLDGYRILLVEDDADSLEMLRIALGFRGADVTPVASSAEALMQLNENKFDLLISDLGLPGMDGYDLIGKIRNELNLSSETLPAIALSGYAAADDRTRSLSAGFQLHLPKPLDLTILTENIATLRSGRQN